MEVSTISHASEISIAEGEVIIIPSEIHPHLADEAYERFQEICQDLNLDVTTKENTWHTFVNVKQKFTLEVSE